MIDVQGVSKSFGQQVVLNNVSLNINKGEIISVLGESGVGKSVLLKLMMGLIRPDQGHIIIDGQDVTHLEERELLIIRKRIGYLFQEGALYDFMNVYDNIAFPLREHTALSKSQIKEKVDNILRLIDLQGVNSKYPSELSGGMKKRVALARAVILDSHILFCDEPTSGLDPIRSRDISDLIRNISRKLNCTTVMTSHDIVNSFRVADRVALIKDGSIVAVGSPPEIESSENVFVREFIK